MQAILLVQHCQSHHHVDRAARLWPDRKNGLTDLGRHQAEAVAVRLHRAFVDSPCRIYSSDMQRTVETAKIIAAKFGETSTPFPEFREWNGRFAVERDEDGEEWEIDETNFSLFDWRPFPKAETWREFHARVSARMEKLAKNHIPEQIPILVVHGGTLSNIVTCWLSLELDSLPERTPFSATPGSITILLKNRHGNPLIERLNDRTHLYQSTLADDAQDLHLVKP